MQIKGEMMALENNMDMDALPQPAGMDAVQLAMQSQVSVQSEDWFVMDMGNATKVCG